MHELHCREDRCAIGCGCPHHRGEPVPELPGPCRRVDGGFSLRYGVMGWYLSRDRRFLLVYPLPFTRLRIRLGREEQP